MAVVGTIVGPRHLSLGWRVTEIGLESNRRWKSTKQLRASERDKLKGRKQRDQFHHRHMNASRTACEHVCGGTVGRVMSE